MKASIPGQLKASRATEQNLIGISKQIPRSRLKEKPPWVKKYTKKDDGYNIVNDVGYTKEKYHRQCNCLYTHAILLVIRDIMNETFTQ